MMVLGLAAPVSAGDGDPIHLLHMSCPADPTPQGDPADVAALYTNTTADDVDGWSYGVSHDPSAVTLDDAVHGSDTLTAKCGEEPDFLSFPGVGIQAGLKDHPGELQRPAGLSELALALEELEAPGTLGDGVGVAGHQVFHTDGTDAIAVERQ